MQLFQGMSIDGQPEKLRRLPDEIEKRLTGGWSRNRPRESKMNKSSLSSELYCFHCEEAPDREAVDVWLSRDSNQLRVSNIVPSDVSELSYAQYNAILKEFAESSSRWQPHKAWGCALRSLGLTLRSKTCYLPISCGLSSIFRHMPTRARAHRIPETRPGGKSS
jgi:hypothetical protein